jgi:hypothetical protein
MGKGAPRSRSRTMSMSACSPRSGGRKKVATQLQPGRPEAFAGPSS